MSKTYKAGPRRQTWEWFNFVSERTEGSLDFAMIWSEFELDHFEPGGSKSVGSWDEIAKEIVRVCSRNSSRVGFLRLSGHGDVGAFKMGRSIFALSNSDKWRPVVAQVAAYFVPGVSFVTIDTCKTGAEPEILREFSKALGGVDVRGYERIQRSSTSAENGRGPYVTCRRNACVRTAGF